MITSDAAAIPRCGYWIATLHIDTDAHSVGVRAAVMVFQSADCKSLADSHYAWVPVEHSPLPAK